MPTTTIRLSGAAQAAFAAMCEEFYLEPADVPADSLGLMFFALRAIKDGHSVGAFDAKTGVFTEITTPALTTVKEKMQAL